MIVHWLVDGVRKDATGEYQAGLATNRYRAILPARGLSDLGHRVELVNMKEWDAGAYSPDNRPDVLVVGKLLPSQYSQQLSRRILEGVAAAQSAGIKVIADVNDDHFQNPQLGAYWTELVQRVDGVVAGSQAMAEAVSGYTSRPVHVVGDPVAAPLGEPKAFRRATGWQGGLQRVLEAMGSAPQRLRLAWYGNPVNWPSMAAWVPALVKLAERQPWYLQVISRPGMGIETFVSGFNAARKDVALMEFVPWSEESVWDQVQDAHIVLIPSDLADAGKRVKSSNRLVDAINSGCFVVASPVPAYQEFADYAWLGDDPAAGIEWALSHAGEVLKQIHGGQQRVSECYSLLALSGQWLNAISAIPRTPELGSECNRSLPLASTHVLADSSPEIELDTSVLSAQHIWDLYTSWFYDTQVWKEMAWHGVRTLKVPADMWNYQEIIFERKVEHVIETGTRHGGSALFFAEALLARGASGPVISIDIDDASRNVRSHRGIHFMLGSSASAEMVERVRSLLPEKRGPVFLILDSDHAQKHVFAELEVWVPFLLPGDYLVVEDTNVNGHPVRPDHGPGPWEAIMDYRRAHPGLLEPDVRREQKFGSTAAPNGYYIRSNLRRVSSGIADCGENSKS